MANTRREDYGLPPRLFLYTLDQLASIVNVPIKEFQRKYIHYDGRAVGARPFEKIMARNIAPKGEPPDWRVVETEFVRWMRFKGFKVYVRGMAHS